MLYLPFHKYYLTVDGENATNLHALIPNSYGLAPGSLVELSGVTIGRVDAVTLTPNAQVMVDLAIQESYSELVKVGSKLKISSQLGLDTVISGARLELVPGEATGLRMQNGDEIAILAPQSLQDLVEEFELEALAQQVKSIVANLETVTTSIADQQQSIGNTLANIERITANTATASAELGPLMAQMETTIDSANRTLHTVDSSVREMTDPAVDLIKASEQTLITTESVMTNLQPTLDTLPGLLQSADQAVQSLNFLSVKLANHWLLGGQGELESIQPQLQFPYDASLYEMPEN